MSNTAVRPAWQQGLGLFAWIVPSFIAAASGIGAGPGEWYASLNKPFYNPPNWIFGPVWTTLYIMMGVAAWRVWRRGPWSENRGPLGLYLLQLLLNALWTPIFFRFHQMGWALVEIVMLWVAIAATIRAFSTRDRIAAWMLAPYLAWVSFASFLNASLWWLNR